MKTIPNVKQVLSLMLSISLVACGRDSGTVSSAVAEELSPTYSCTVGPVVEKEVKLAWGMKTKTKFQQYNCMSSKGESCLAEKSELGTKETNCPLFTWGVLNDSK